MQFYDENTFTNLFYTSLSRQNRLYLPLYVLRPCFYDSTYLSKEEDRIANLSVCCTAFRPSSGFRLHQTQTIKPVTQTKHTNNKNVIIKIMFSASAVSSSRFSNLAASWHPEESHILEAKEQVTVGLEFGCHQIQKEEM